jgi:hypothetical protein
MVRPGRDRLNDIIEMDESYIGGIEEEVGGRCTEKKSIIGIATQARGKRAIGRIRLKRIPEASASSIEAFARQAIEEGSTIVSDGWSGYAGKKHFGYEHVVKVIRGSGQAPHKLLPQPHRISSLLDRLLLGTYQGAVSGHHLDYYLDEFTFRFNPRTVRHRGKLF